MQKTHHISPALRTQLCDRDHDLWLAGLLERLLPADHPKHLTLSFYLNGEAHAPLATEAVRSAFRQRRASELPASFRLTNVQLVDEAAAATCVELERAFGRTFFCNLYFTPGPGRDCFSWHPDMSETVALQLAGEKEWRFLRRSDGSLLTHLSDGPVPAAEGFALEALVLAAGDAVLAPYGVVHSAALRGPGPSVHVSFASVEVGLRRFLQGLSRSFDLGEIPDVNRQLPAEEDELLALARSFVPERAEEELRRLVQLFIVMELRRSAEVRRHGEPYVFETGSA